MSEAILVINTAGSSVPIPAVDTILQSGNVKPTQYNNVMISTSVQITGTGATVSQNLTFKLKLAPLNGQGVITLATWTYKPLLNTAVINNQRFVYMTDDTHTVNTNSSIAVGGLLSLTVVGAGADAATSAICQNIYVNSID